MNCTEWEGRIAADPEDPAVERHVGECAACAGFAAGMREALGVLRSAHEEEIAPAHYAAVRARVMAELRPGRRWGWVWAAAAAAAAVVIGMGVERRMRVEELGQVAVAPPKVELPLPYGRAASSGSERGLPRVVKAKRKRAEEIVMKIETGDPDVVIYWIAETKGDE